MVQEYKNTDLDLFDKIDLTNPKDELLKKNKIGSSQQENNNIKFNYLNHEISKFENLESHLSQDKSKKVDDILFSQLDVDDYASFKNMYPHNISQPKLNVSKLSVKKHINEDGTYPNLASKNTKDKTSEIFQGIYPEPKFLPGGDKYLLIEFGNVMNLELNFKAQGLSNLIKTANIKGVYETLPCFASMIVHYNPDDIGYQDLINELKSLLKDMRDNDDTVVNSRLFHFPTVYLDKWTKEAIEDYIAKITMKKPDPEFITELNQLDDVNHFVRVHSGTEYWVASLGFWPGLPFTMPLDPRCKLTAPKYNPPRTWTPKGTVGMGGSSTAIYPDRLPGGYQIFGRTPVPIWDPDKNFDVFKDSICLFRPGDRIKFVPCDYDEFEMIEKKVEDKSYRYDLIEEHKFSIKKYKNWLSKLDYNKKF